VSRSGQALAMTALVVVLAGCGSDGDGSGGGTGGEVKAAPHAEDPACTALSGRLPAKVLDRPRGALEVAGAADWGDPAIVLRCGVPAPAPTTDPCLDVDGVAWVFTETKAVFRFVSFGRDPAVEVTVPTSIDRTTAPGALTDLAATVSPVPTTSSKCYG
jgi:hypothetical protein